MPQLSITFETLVPHLCLSTDIIRSQLTAVQHFIGKYIFFNFCIFGVLIFNKKKSYKVIKGAKIRNRYNQVPHLTQDTNGKVTNSQLYTANESQEVSPFSAGDQKASINRRSQRHSKYKTEKT